MTTTHDLLAGHRFLAGMPADSLERLARHGTHSVLPVGSRLFVEGGTADRFWLINSGRVALDFQVPGRGDVVLETLGAGTVLGWSWLFAPYEWHFGAVVLEETEAVELSGPGVLEVCEDQPEFGHELCRRFLGVMLDRLQATRVRLLDLYGPPTERTP